MNRAQRITILSRLKENNPKATTELNFNSPFQLLIAVVLSAQTSDERVNKVTEKLYAVANNPKAMLALGIDNLKSYIKSIGLFNKKAKNIIQICQILVALHSSQVPRNRSALLSLPGVGSKSANVVLNTAFGFPTIGVDTHVFRVCNRSGFAKGNNVKKVEQKLLKVVPKAFKASCHHLFVLHGRYTCIARKPNCRFCCIEDLCTFSRKVYSKS